MGIKFLCPNGHKLHVKAFLSGKRAICPKCGARVLVPAESSIAPVEKDPGSAFETSSVDLSTAELVAAAATAATLEARQQAGGNDRSIATLQAATAPLVDPIAEAPGALWYVRPATGGQFGPASADIMRCWVNEGRVGASSLVWRAGWPEWRSAAATFPQLGLSEAPPGIAFPQPAAPSIEDVSSRANGPAPPLPLGQLVDTLAEPPGITPGSSIAVPAAAPGTRKRRRNNDVSLLVSVILIVVSIILVIILILVWRRQNDPGENEKQTTARAASRQCWLVGYQPAQCRPHNDSRPAIC
jgi:hypothetical protein